MKSKLMERLPDGGQEMNISLLLHRSKDREEITYVALCAPCPTAGGHKLCAH